MKKIIHGDCLEEMKKLTGNIVDDYIIVDPFAGSGTTGVACENLNRDYILIEKDEKYIEIIKNRLK